MSSYLPLLIGAIFAFVMPAIVTNYSPVVVGPVAGVTGMLATAAVMDLNKRRH